MQISTIITLYNVCSVPWGGGGCSVLGVVHYRGGIISNMGGYLEYSGDVQYCGGYHEYRGSVQYRGGKSLSLFEYLHGTKHPHGTHDILPRY